MSQKSRVLMVLQDYQPHSTFEIMERLYPSGKAGLFRLAAVVHALKERGHHISGWRDTEVQNKYWYKLEPRQAFTELFGHEELAGPHMTGAYSR